MKAVLCDIDGVLLKDDELIAGADEFLKRLGKAEGPLLLLTNYPSQTPGDLQDRFQNAGVDLPADCFYTSAMATAAFLKRQEGRKAYVVGEGALTHELYRIGYTISDINPDFVVVGETRAFNFDMIQKASSLILAGARFVATNPDNAGPDGRPACGALCAPIELITGKRPFYVGKPSPWIMRAALNRIKAHSGNAVMIGDNMSTDIRAGVQAGLETALVLSGVTRKDDLGQFAYRPTHIFASVAEIDIDELLADEDGEFPDESQAPVRE